MRLDRRKKKEKETMKMVRAIRETDFFSFSVFIIFAAITGKVGENERGRPEEEENETDHFIPLLM